MGSSTGCEINIESIKALERRVKEGSGDIIRLKRARNSLLNIFTRVPPEILEDITSMGYARALTTLTSSSFTIIGSRSHLALQNFGVSREKLYGNDKSSTAILELPPLA